MKHLARWIGLSAGTVFYKAIFHHMDWGQMWSAIYFMGVAFLATWILDSGHEA